MLNSEITQDDLDKMNVAQARKENKCYLELLGGIPELIRKLGITVETGLTPEQVLLSRAQYGDNSMPSTRTTSYLKLLVAALSDTTLIILIIGASVSFGLGLWEDPKIGWIEGTAIFIAVFLVSNISACNDYSKELQFRALEASSQNDERTSVFRLGAIDLIAPSELVVGDIIVLQVSISILSHTNSLTLMYAHTLTFSLPISLIPAVSYSLTLPFSHYPFLYPMYHETSPLFFAKNQCLCYHSETKPML